MCMVHRLIPKVDWGGLHSLGDFLRSGDVLSLLGLGLTVEGSIKTITLC